MSMEEIDEALRTSAFSQSNPLIISQTLSASRIEPSFDSTTKFISAGSGQLNTVADRPRTIETKCKTIALIGVVEDIRPTHNWSDAFFFPAALNNYLESVNGEINESKASAWPFIMRNGSLVMVGSRSNSEAVCLPAICASVTVN